MKILVCIKQVPQKDAPLKVNESGNWIREEVSYEVNEPDAYALEEALRQKEKHGGEVVVITSGPARSQQVLREALAKGADRALHLEDAGFAGLDALNTARAFAAAIKDEKFDLILTGLQSDDYGYAQTGVVLAELLGWPHGTIIMQIEKTAGGIRGAKRNHAERNGNCGDYVLGLITFGQAEIQVQINVQDACRYHLHLDRQRRTSGFSQ